MNTRTVKQISLPVVILIGAGITFYFLLNKPQPLQQKVEPIPVPHVSTVVVDPQPYTLRVPSQGIVEPRYRTEMVFQVEGNIVAVSEKFLRGEIVKQGTVLAQVDPFDYEVALEQAKAALADAEAQFILENAQGKVAQAEWSKISDLEPSELGLRKPQQEQALARVKAAQAALDKAEKNLERTQLIAPFDGLVEKRSVSLGTYAHRGNIAGVLSDVSVAEVRLPVSRQDMGDLEENGGQTQVELYLSESHKRPFLASIVRNEGVVDSQSRMTYLVAEIIDPYRLKMDAGYELPFGSFIQASILGRTLDAAVRIPRSVLIDNSVLTLKDGRLQFSTVDIARHEGPYSVVKNGLQRGAEVIVSPLEYPVEGMIVTTSTEKKRVGDDNEAAAYVE